MSLTQTQTAASSEVRTNRQRTLSTTLYGAASSVAELLTADSRGKGDCPVQWQSEDQRLQDHSGTPDSSFDILFPIMARLPLDHAKASPDEDSLDFEEPYFRTASGVQIPGGLAYDPKHDGVLYTRARLPQLDSAGKALWVALHKFRPLTSSYAGDFQCQRKQRRGGPAQCPMNATSGTALDLVRRVFNWSELNLPSELSAEFFGVVFRSKRAAGSESTNLMRADKLSHEEAVNHGGLLMYWYGMPDPVTGSNLASCIWRTQDEARLASALPLHKEAVKHARVAYAGFELSRYKVVKRAGEVGVHIEAWD